MKRNDLPTVEQCVAYMASLNWRLTCRHKWTYAFANPNAAAHITPMWFNLKELRDAYRGIGF
jgi:hypothetical protein